MAVGSVMEESVGLAVLMVDDDRDDFVLLERMLRRVEQAYVVEWVGESDAAFEVILRQDHDVYLIDLKLGPDDGLDLIERCRSAGCDRPMILLTGHEAPRFGEASIERGAADYLSKHRVDAGWVDRSIRHAIARWSLQRRIRLAELRFRRAFELAPIGIVLTNADLGVVDANASMRELVGDGATFDGRHLDEAMGGALAETIRRTRGGEAVHAAGRLDAGGSERHVELIAAEFGEVVDGATHLVLVVDVTDLIEARSRLERLLSDKDEFLASVSHELRTPLTAVLGFASVLLQEGNTLEELERSGLLKTVHQQALELSNIVEDLLVAARIETDQLHVKPSSISVAREIDDVVGAFALNGTARPPVIGADRTGVADPIRFRQIVRNLFSNALRFGGPNVRVEIGGTAEVVAVRVVDDGPGPDSELVESIFEPYVHVQWERTPASIGLGLAVSRHLARLMGGDISYSRQGDESVFELTIPAGRSE